MTLLEASPHTSDLTTYRQKVTCHQNLEHRNGSTPKLTCNGEMWSLLDIFPPAGLKSGTAGASGGDGGERLQVDDKEEARAAQRPDRAAPTVLD